MALPLLIIAGSAVAGAGGVASAGVGAKKMLNARSEMKSIIKQHEENQRRFNDLNQATTGVMSDLGALELEVCESFDSFTELFEKIKNRPEFDDITVGSFDVPRYDARELKDVSIAASLLVGAIGGIGTGAASGVAAAVAAKGVIAAFCVASTGTPITALHGIAATNAILAILGGGTLAAGGGGIALGSTVLSAATVGVGILVGGIVFNLVGRSMSGTVDKARKQMEEAGRQIGKICKYLGKLKTMATRYVRSLSKVYAIYQDHMARISHIVIDEGRTDWDDFSADEKLALENLTLLTAVLYEMCKTNLVIESDSENGINEVNSAEAKRQLKIADALLDERGLSSADSQQDDKDCVEHDDADVICPPAEAETASERYVTTCNGYRIRLPKQL